MAESFKNRYNELFLETFSQDLQRVIHDFDTDKFISLILDNEWENKGYKQRTAHIAKILGTFLPSDYPDAVARIVELVECVKEKLPDLSKIDDKNFGLLTLEYGAILDNYVEQYGIDDYETSVWAIEKITRFTTCEFATHAFIAKYPDKMMKQMLAWSKHEHWAVRRLASEGCRPRLPWAMSLPNLKEDPAPIIPILENLKNDPSRFVRLSVANNLNDMAKDHPETVMALAKSWKGESRETDWVIKHGCRTLLKQGNQEVMRLFGLDSIKNITVSGFNMLTPEVKVGDFLEFCFHLTNNHIEKTGIRLEYAMYYQKSKGKLGRKVYKISEKEYAGNSATHITRKHAFRRITTRIFYPGLHQIALIINGYEQERHDFALVE